MTKISVVTSLFRSAPYIKEFYMRHLSCLKQLNVTYEFIFVDDGSPDNSQEIVRELISNNEHITLISFSRNFGQHPAMFAGLAEATGDLIYALDCDLEDVPENIIPMFYKITTEPIIDVVYGVFNRRSGDFFRNKLSNLFYTMLDVLSEIKIPRNQAWQRIMNKKYVNALLQYKETETFPAGVMSLAGFNQVPLLLEKKYKGSTTYTLKKRIHFAINSITSFSSKPLILVGIIGLIITVLAFMAIIIILIKNFFYVRYQSGWSSIIASIWFIGGLILSSIGIVGIYLARIFNQIKNRPLYIIKSIEKS